MNESLNESQSNFRRSDGQSMFRSGNVERTRTTAPSTDTAEDAGLPVLTAAEDLLEELEAFKAIYIHTQSKLVVPSAENDGAAQLVASSETREGNSDVSDGPSTSPLSSLPSQQNYLLPPTPESQIGSLLGESLQIMSVMGSGPWGVLYSAVDHSTSSWYFAKFMSKFNPDGELLDKRQRTFQLREIQLHYAASAHPYILSMLKIFEEPRGMYVILENCLDGDLFFDITERRRYINNDILIRYTFLQILDAVEHCHRLGIYHRDIKPENIWVFHQEDRVVLAEFGLATTDSFSVDFGCGTSFYMSPGRPSSPFPINPLTLLPTY